MQELLAVLTPIALLDSTSMAPVGVVALTTIMASRRPVAGSLAFIFGTFVTYLAFGILVSFGLDTIFDALNDIMAQKLKNPNTTDLILQIIIGVVLVAIGWRSAGSRGDKAQKRVDDAATPGRALTAGIVLVLVGLPGALPYFAAIDQILKLDVAPMDMTAALLFYNGVFVLPLVGFVIVGALMGERGQRFLQRLNAFLEKWGRRVVIVLLLVLDVALIADGIGWFFGRPLIPIGL